MRFETHRVSEHVVQRLTRAPPVRAILEDGGDIVEFVLGTGETVRLYLIENPLAIYEIQGIVGPNSAQGVHTLFILWADMLLPGDGQRVTLDSWTAALLALYGDRVYAYDFNGPDIDIFAVYYDGAGYTRVVRDGQSVDFETLAAWTAPVSSFFTAPALAAGFDAARGEQAAPDAGGRGYLHAEYAALGLAPGASRAAVKRAYRRLALRNHPDVNPDPEAHARMQQINAAYRRLLAEPADE